MHVHGVSICKCFSPGINHRAFCARVSSCEAYLAWNLDIFAGEGHRYAFIEDFGEVCALYYMMRRSVGSSDWFQRERIIALRMAFCTASYVCVRRYFCVYRMYDIVWLKLLVTSGFPVRGKV